LFCSHCQLYCDIRLSLDKHRVSLSGSSSLIGKVKCTSDDSCRDTADSAKFENQSCPHCPFLFLQPYRPIKVHIQLCPRACDE
ncbi:unnamed protein product, partial [Hymenolepis diminuta]